MCDKIIEAKGTIVPDENLRTGRRAQKMHGEGDRKTKSRKRDRKSTHLLELPMHPVLKGAYAILMGLEGGGGGLVPSLLSGFGVFQKNKAGPLFRNIVRNLGPLWEDGARKPSLI